MSAMDHKRYMVRGSVGTIFWVDTIEQALDMQEKVNGVVYELVDSQKLVDARFKRTAFKESKHASTNAGGVSQEPTSEGCSTPKAQEG